MAAGAGVGAAGPRQRMLFAALLSLCLLALLQRHTFTAWPPLWCGNEHNPKNGRCLVYAEVKGTGWRSRAGERAGREPAGSSFVGLCAPAPGPFQAVSYRVLSQAPCPGSQQEPVSPRLTWPHLWRLCWCHRTEEAVCFLLKVLCPSPGLQWGGLLDECLFKWGPQAHSKGVPESRWCS